MFTVCPKCALTLVVTAGDLKVGQGYVRCGRCSNVFNALVGLSDERKAAETKAAESGLSAPSPGPPGRQAPAPSPSPASEPQTEPESVSESELEFTADDLAEVFLEPHAGAHDVSSSSFETIVLEGSTNDDDAEGAAAANDATLEDEGAANDPELLAGETAQEISAGFDRSRVEVPRRRAETPSVIEEPAETEPAMTTLAEAVPAAPSWRRSFAWSFGIAALVLTLAAQFVHHYRNELAVDARFREPLSTLYDAIGMSLAPRWNLTAYDVRQLGASAGGRSGEGALIVRASVQNGGADPQPMPLLRVTVQDRFGNRIASRDVTPGAYAARAAAISPFLDSGERVDAEIRLADPGPEAVGFELDACLPFESGRIACANDQRVRPR